MCVGSVITMLIGFTDHYQLSNRYQGIPQESNHKHYKNTVSRYKVMKLWELGVFSKITRQI